MEECPDALEFLADIVDLLLLGLGLTGITLDLILKLCLALPELRLLAAPGLPAQIEQGALRRDRAPRLQIAVSRPFKQGRRKYDLIGAVALGLEARLTGKQFVETLGDDRCIR